MTQPTTTFQISDKRGDAILVVKTEGIDPDATYQAFAAAVQDGGLDNSLGSFGQGLVQAVTNAQPLTVPPVYAAAGQQPPAQEPWGNPPVPPMPAAAAPAGPVGGPPVCQHGPKQYKSGTGAKGPWAFWGCTARSDDPSKCEKQWVR